MFAATETKTNEHQKSILLSVANPGLEVRSCRNVVLLNRRNNRITILRYFNNNSNNNNNNNGSKSNIMPLLSYMAKHFFYTRPVLVVWRRTTSQTGAFAIVFCYKAIHIAQSKKLRYPYVSINIRHIEQCSK
jgi:hypothetical protein